MTTDSGLKYNAEVVDVRYVHDALMILRVQHDNGRIEFLPGQYTTLGLRTDEPRIDKLSGEESDAPHLIRRAYSISHPLVDDKGELLSAVHTDFLEFYITLVLKGSDTPPSLTPRLFNLQADRRIFVDPRVHGRYTLESVKPTDNVIFAATGSGEAPHNAMVNELLSRSHQGHIASIVSVRRHRDLGYLEAHRQLERCFPKYRYIPLTTRESENTDANHPKYVGKLYLQDVFQSESLPERLGFDPTPADTHVFLCGSPDMIGLPVNRDGVDEFPSPQGMIEILTQLGFQPDRPRQSGNVHFEKYW